VTPSRWTAAARAIGHRLSGPRGTRGWPVPDLHGRIQATDRRRAPERRHEPECAGAQARHLARAAPLDRGAIKGVKKHEAGEFASNGPAKTARRVYEPKVASLEHKVGRPTIELDLFKKGATSAHRLGCDVHAAVGVGGAGTTDDEADTGCPRASCRSRPLSPLRPPCGISPRRFRYRGVRQVPQSSSRPARRSGAPHGRSWSTRTRPAVRGHDAPFRLPSKLPEAIRLAPARPHSGPAPGPVGASPRTAAPSARARHARLKPRA
jgi:hypothetical protein